MYGQVQNSVASAAKWIFSSFVVVIVMALLLGVNVKDATWLNPSIAKAQAERIQIDSAHQQANYELQERLAAAQTESEIQTIQREQKKLDAQYEHGIQMLNQDLLNHQRWADTKLNFVTLLGNVAIITVGFGLLFIALATSIAIVRKTPKVQAVAVTTTSKKTHHLPQYQPLGVPQKTVEPLQQLDKERLAKRIQELLPDQKVDKETATYLSNRQMIARMKTVLNYTSGTDEYANLPHAN